MRTTLLRAATAALVCAATAASAPGTAYAAPAPATASMSQGTVYYRAAPGQINRLTITEFIDPDGAVLTVLDDDVSITPGPGCRNGADTTVAVCWPTVWAVDINVGDMHDQVDKRTATASRIVGGTGNDTLSGGPSPAGGPVAPSAPYNVLIGGEGADVLVGGIDSDSLDGGPGADTLTGGDGFDQVTYADRTARVVADVDGVAGDDGEVGEGDSIAADVEELIGGKGNDLLGGNAQRNLVWGGDGADELNGLAGDDFLFSGRGSDLIRGGDGNDTIETGEGANRAYGQAGDDLFYLEPFYDTGVPQGWGTNTVYAGPGNDRVYSGRGADAMWGEGGFDWVDYQFQPNGVEADLDPATLDGTLGENDRIYEDVEAIAGGPSTDRLTGNSGPNRLLGRGGPDTLRGGDGEDWLGGGADADDLDGGLGYDRCNEGAGGSPPVNCEGRSPDNDQEYFTPPLIFAAGQLRSSSHP